MNGRPVHLGYVLKRFPRISETFVATELLELRRQGERVTVFALSRPDEPFTHRFLDELDVRVVYLPRRPLGEPLRVARGLAGIRHDVTGGTRAAAQMLRPPTLTRWRRLVQAAVLLDELRAAEVDHVHAHFASTAARLAELAWLMGGPPYSVTAHAKDIYHRDVDPVRLRETLGAARFVATVSESNVRHLRVVLGGRGRVELVPNSVDVDRVTAACQDRAPEPHMVLTVARLVEKKGLDDLVRACGSLTRRGVAVRLELIGEGPMGPYLQRLAADEGVDARFSGAVDHDGVLERYRRASVFALPCKVASTGDRDGLPTAVLEAMAAGVPAVTTAVNGLAEVVVHERTGLTVPERDPVALADALERLLTDPAAADTLGRAGQRHVVDRFSLTTSVARLRSLFGTAATTTPALGEPAA